MTAKSPSTSAPDKWRVQDDQQKPQQGAAGKRRIDQHKGAPDRSQKQSGQDLRDPQASDANAK